MAIENLIDGINDGATSLVRMKEATHAHVPTFSHLTTVVTDDRDYL